MGYNKKVLSEAIANLNKRAAPARKKDAVKIIDKEGQRKHPGQVTTILGDSMATDGYGDIPLMVYPNNGQPPQLVEANTGPRYFPGATEFTEVPVAKKGGQKTNTKKYSRSLSATNKLFDKNPLFKKPKSKKKKIFDPNAKYYQIGGPYNTSGPVSEQDEIQEYTPVLKPKAYGHEPEDYSQFQNFAQTLPSNLQDPGYQYGNPDQYDLYGMWSTVGKPVSFTDVQDTDYFPLQDDGTYHGFSVGDDGTLLKPMKHGTTWMEVMNSQLNTDPYFRENALIKNEQGRLQYIPRRQEGGDEGVSPLEGNYISKVIMNRNRGVDFVDRAFALGDNPGTPMFNVPDDEQFGSWMSHKMAIGEGEGGKTWMFPTVLNPNNEAIEVPGQYADYISSEGYKYATGMKQKGGYVELDLTPKEIEQYKKDGYVVEELPKAQTGLNTNPYTTVDSSTGLTRPMTEEEKAQHSLKFMQGWASSPMHKEMLRSSIIRDNPQANIDEQLDIISGLRSKATNPSISILPPNNKMPAIGEAEPYMFYDIEDSMNLYGVDKNKIPATLPSTTTFYTQGRPGEHVYVYPHEFSHIQDMSGSLMPVSDKSLIKSYRNQEFLKGLADVKQNTLEKLGYQPTYDYIRDYYPNLERYAQDKEMYENDFNKFQKQYADKDYFESLSDNKLPYEEFIKQNAKNKFWGDVGFKEDYIGTHTETRARLNAIRQMAKDYGIYDPYTEKLTPEKYKEIENLFRQQNPNEYDVNQLRQLKEVFSDDEIFNMMNTISKNDSSTPELTRAQKGGMYYTYPGSEGVYRKVGNKWEVDWNRSGNFQPLSKGDVAERTAKLNKGAKQLFDQDYYDLVENRNQAFQSAPAKQVAKKPTAQQIAAQKVFDKDFKVTGKSNYEKVEDQIQKDIQEAKKLYEQSGLEWTKADEDEIANRRWNLSGVGTQYDSGVIQTPSKSTTYFNAPENPTFGDYAGKVWDIITNPIDYFNYSVATGDMMNAPWDITDYERALDKLGAEDPILSRNAVGKGLDLASYFNPVTGTLQAIKTAAEIPGLIGKARQTGDWSDAGWALGETALEMIPGMGAADDIARASKYLTTQTPLKNTYKINPFAVKENPEMFLYRARPVGQNLDMNMAAQLRAKESAGETLNWWQKNIADNKMTSPEFLAREKYYGQWFEKDPSRLDFYINPETRNFADNDAIEILRTRLPREEAAKLNVSQFDDAKILSASPETEFILSKDMINSAERFPENSWQQLVQEDKAFNTPNWLKGYKKTDVPKELPGSGFANSNFFNPKVVQATNPVKQLFSDIKGSFETAGKDIKHYINNYSNIKKAPSIYKDEIAKLLTPEGKQRLIDLGVDDIDDFMKYLDRAKVSTRRNLPTSALEVNRKGKLTPIVNLNFEQLNDVFESKKLSENRLRYIIAHELGHNIQGYLESIGKAYKGNTELDIKAVDELFPFATQEVKNFFKESTGLTDDQAWELIENASDADFNPIANAQYALRGEGKGKEIFPHLRELKQQMLQKGVIKNIHDNITIDDIQKFYSDFGGSKNRILSFIKKDGYEVLAKLLNKTPLLIPGIMGAGALGAAGSLGTNTNSQKEFKKGGTHNIGDEIELTDEQVKELKRLGYTLEIVK